MVTGERVLVTGGSGLLGGELKRLLPEADFPSSADFDVRDFGQMQAYAERRPFDVLLHAAAFTSPPRVDKDPRRALETNVVGTANAVKLCMLSDARLIYVSTDYVFRGDQGSYREEDSLYPLNRYAWSKLGGECAARLYERALIVRTSFGENEFPFEKAFVDQWTSRESVREIATKLVPLLGIPCDGVVHVGGARRTVYEYARGVSPDRSIGELSTQDVNFEVPRDTSLDCQRYRSLTGGTKAD